MAAKRQQQFTTQYAEDSYSSDGEDDEVDMDLELEYHRDHNHHHHHHNHQQQQQRVRTGRPGRPRRVSINTASSPELAVSGQLDVTGSVVTSPDLGSVPPPRRRGRGPSKRPCLNRNAQMARENRLKKKAYLERIEQKLEQYRRENQELRARIQRQSEEIRELSDRANHYKSALANNSEVTLLLRSLNDSLRSMHGNRTSTADQAGLRTAAADGCNVVSALATKTNSDVRWAHSAQTNELDRSAPYPESPSKDIDQESGRKANFRQISLPKIARKTMPLINYASLLPKTEEPAGVENLMEEDEPKYEQSPESHSCCEYNANANSVGSSNHLPTTPMSAISSSLDKGEASLSETDFSQLSSLNVDLTNFDKLNCTPYPLQLEQDPPITFNEDTILDYILNDSPNLLNTESNDMLDLARPDEKSKQKTLFNTLEHSGICLHINSSKVTLEYCSKCYENSLSKSVEP